MGRYRMRSGLSLILVFVLLAGLFAGCAGSKASAPDLLTVRQKSTQNTISIGFTRAEVEKITGTKLNGGIDFVKEGRVGDFYMDAPGIRVDYMDDVVVGIMLLQTGDWELMNGVAVGMQKADVEEKYKDVDVREAGEEGGILISYDESCAPIPLDEFAPYFLTVSFAMDGRMDAVHIKQNL